MKLSSLGFITLLALAANAAAGERGLSQIRHALFLDRNAPVEADLRVLAERGDRPSMHQLANVIANNPKKTDEAIELYKQSFAEGRGEIRALTALIRLLDRQPQRQAANHAYIKKALQQFPLERDPYTLEAALEAFVVFPKHFPLEQVEQLIKLYDRSCLELCSSDLYRAVHADSSGQREQAIHWYERAVRATPRAVERYYRFLGEDRDALFQDFASRLAPARDELLAEVNFAIGDLLSRIARDEFNESQAQFLAARLQRELTEAEQEQQEAHKKRFDGFNDQAQLWILAAVEQDFAPALSARINYFLSRSTDYTPADVQPLIERLNTLDPARAKTAQAQLKMVVTWSSLDPEGAHQLIKELIAEGADNGQIMLARLYSAGLLDQPNQARALDILHKLTEQGSIIAHYQIALLYNEGRGLCRDPAIAYAHARVALEAGDQRAKSVLTTAKLVATPEQLEQGKTLYHQLTARTP